MPNANTRKENGNGKSKTYSRNSDSRRRDFGKETGRIKCHVNDISFYNKSPQLLKDAAQISISNGVGFGLEALPVGWNGNSSDTRDTVKHIPSIIVYGTNLNFGTSLSATSALNIASRNIYSYVRHANSGSRNYEASDMMLYIGACDNCFAMYSHIVKMYGSLTNFSQRNRYVPSGLVQAMGLDLEDGNVYNELAAFRTRINVIANKLSTLYVPKDYPIFTRHFQLMGAVLADNADDMKTQIYTFRPDGYFKFNATKYTTGGCLEYHQLGDYVKYDLKTYDQWCDILDDMIDTIISTEDMGIMSGDILKAYGKENLLSVSQIAEDFRIVPEYEATMCEQIRNIKCTGMIIDKFDAPAGGEPNTIITSDIVQKNNVLYYSPAVLQHCYEGMNYPVLDMMSKEPTPEQFMEATRLIPTLSVPQFGPESDNLIDFDTLPGMTGVTKISGLGYAIVTACGSEFVTNMSMVVWSPSYNEFTWGSVRTGLIDQDGSIVNIHTTRFTNAIVRQSYRQTNGNVNWEVFADMEADLLKAYLSPFSFAPVLYLWRHRINLTDTGIDWDTFVDGAQFEWWQASLNNYTTLQPPVLRRLHDVALMSELNVPNI